MKKITKLFAAFCTLAAAVSCADRLSVNDEIQGEGLIPFVIKAQMPDTKATVSGLEVLWQAGDKIAVFDGTAKREFTLSSGVGTKTAFFSGEIAAAATKISAVAPYSAAGDAAGEYNVPTNQQLSSTKSIDPAAVIMVAAEVDKDATLAFKNPCGIVRMTIPVGAASVYFGTDCFNATVGLGTVVSSPKTIDVVVPADEYNDVFVGIQTMESAFAKTSDNVLSVKAGSIVNLGDVTGTPATFIGYASELDRFLKDSNKKDAFIVKDLDVTGIELVDTAIITGVFNGCKHSIKNAALKGPLFKANRGKIKNVVIDNDCSIKAPTAGNCAMLVGVNNGVVSGCTNNAPVSVTGAMSAVMYIAGLVADNNKGVIKGCKNTGDISVNVTKTVSQSMIGGVVGRTQNEKGVVMVENCENSGKVSLYVSGTPKNFMLGGVAGSTISNKTGSGSSSATDLTTCPGVGDIKNCHNSGAVSAEWTANTSGSYSNVGGVIGYIEGNLDGCSNSGRVSLVSSTDRSAANTRPALGGVAGCVVRSASNCYNTGEVYATGAFVAGTKNNACTGGNYQVSFGGVFGCIGLGYYLATPGEYMTNCYNTGKLEFRTTKSTGTKTTYSAGGVAAYCSTQTVSDCYNTGDIIFAVSGKSNYLGAVIGSAFSTEISNCFNEGKVSATGRAKELGATSENYFSYQMYLAGVIGYIGSAKGTTLNNLENKGEVSLVDVNTTSVLNYVGGINGSYYSSGYVAKNWKNSGTIKVDCPIACCVGGLSGAYNGDMLNSSNDGAVVANGVKGDYNASAELDKRPEIGGLVGYANAVFASCANTGNVTVTSEYDTFTGGLVGGSGQDTTRVMSWSDNKVDCAIESTSTKASVLGRFRTAGATEIFWEDGVVSSSLSSLSLCGLLNEGNKFTEHSYGPNYVKFDKAANCFVVRPGAIAKFPTFKGNDNDKAEIDNVVLAWQDEKGLFAGTLKVADGNAVVSFADGKEGNVLLLGKKDTVVVWSWHFWVANEAPKDVAIGDYTFLDRNVGATSLNEKSDKSIGVIFQYGRKDPFPCIKYGKYSDSVLYGLKEIYDEKGNAVSVKLEDCAEANNLDNAIKNPTTFYKNKYYNGQKHNYSWITTDATTFGVDNFKALWENGGTKSAYDPCPAGYKIAPIAAWEVVKTQKVTEIWDDSYVTFDESVITSQAAKYQPGVRKKVQFRGCDYGGLRLTITGEVNSNSTVFSFANCIGKAQPTAEVWCANIDPSFTGASVSYFRGTAVKVNASGNGNGEDLSAIKVNALSTGGKYGLNYALPVRCIKEK